MNQKRVSANMRAPVLAKEGFHGGKSKGRCASKEKK